MLLGLAAGNARAQSIDMAAPAAATAVTVPAATSAAPLAKPAVAADNGANEFYGPVKPAESLWSIANRMRPNKQITTEQVLVAIYRSNPRAFYGSINSLNEGAVLRVPNIAEMTALSPAAARVELQRLWSGHSGEQPASRGQPLIDPLQIDPPPPARADTSAPVLAADQPEQTAIAASGVATDPAAAAESVVAEPQTAAEPVASTPPPVDAGAPPENAAVDRSAALQARLQAPISRLANGFSAAAAAVSALLATPSLDRLFALSFAGVLALVLVLAALRRLLASASTPHATGPVESEPTPPGPAGRRSVPVAAEVSTDISPHIGV